MSQINFCHVNDKPVLVESNTYLMRLKQCVGTKADKKILKHALAQILEKWFDVGT